MNALWILNVLVEFAGSIIFLVLGLSGSLYAYGFVGQSLFTRFRWREEFRSTLRWLAPLLVVLSLAALVLQVRELRTSRRTPNPAAPGNGAVALLCHIGRPGCAVPEPQRWL